jgi:hypothetical protein
VSGTCLVVLGLWWARRAGEPVRLGQLATLVYGSLGLAFALPRTSPERRGLDRYLETYPSPVAAAFLEYGDLATMHVSGDFRGTLRAAPEAVQRLERCSGTAAFLSYAREHHVWSLYALGEVRQVAALAPALARTAKEHGNRWMVSAMQAFTLIVARLVGDHRDLASRELAESVALWPDPAPSSLQMQHVLGTGLVELYVGRAAEFHRTLEGQWGGLRRSGLMGVPFMATQLLDLRCRAALAAAIAGAPRAAEALARAADRDAHKLGSLRPAHAAPLAALARAGVANLVGTPEQSARLLEEAIRGFDAIGMQLHAACARRRLGTLRGGSKGEPLLAESDRFMAEQTIVRPDRFTAVIAPGFPD